MHEIGSRPEKCDPYPGLGKRSERVQIPWPRHFAERKDSMVSLVPEGKGEGKFI